MNTVSDRFNAFHLEVAVISERLGWVLGHLDDDPGLSVLQALHADLERLLDVQDCRDDADIPGSGPAKLASDKPRHQPQPTENMKQSLKQDCA
ncbi:MAG TPA: hypothetical protein VIK82_10880 [Porticoccaceae bacterium]